MIPSLYYCSSRETLSLLYVEPCCDHDKNIIFSDGVGGGWWGLTPAGFIPQQAQINCSESVKGDGGGGMEGWGMKRDGEKMLLHNVKQNNVNVS
jgi:hypothetical protein